MATRVDLIELLNRCDLSHPTRIMRGVFEERDFHLTVRGFPWWRHGAAWGDEGVIKLVFENISEGILDLPLTNDNDRDEDLDLFEVISLVDVPWAQASTQRVYTSAPIKDPMRVYALLDAHLMAVGAFTRASRYLNAGDRPYQFVEFATSPSCLLSTAPPSVTCVICTELDVQGVGYTVHDHPDRAEDRLWVRLGDASFLCERAFAEFAR